MKTSSTSNLPKARISRLSRKDIEAYQEALGNDAYSKELVAEFAVAHVKAHALQTEIYRRIASGNKRKDSEKALSPNAERARIIAKAKAFVEGLMGELLPGESIQFIEYRDKRRVVARRTVLKTLVGINGATTHPDDVYNIHIGKAIAIGRLLGKDVSEFENAPVPTEPVVGHKLSNESNEGIDEITTIRGDCMIVNNSVEYWCKATLESGVTKIIDDTDAIY